jgi:hypothetical protein
MEKINEHLKRMQELAGIITESKNNTNDFPIFEQVSDEQIKQAAASVLQIPVNQIVTEPNTNNQKEIIKEIEIMSVISLVSLIPFILNLLGSGINKLKQTFGISEQQKIELERLNKLIATKEKYIKSLDKKNSPKEMDERKKLDNLKKEKDKKFGSLVGNFFKTSSHAAHSAFIYPIVKFLQLINFTSPKVGKKLKIDHEIRREAVADIIYCVIMISLTSGAVIHHLSSQFSHLNQVTNFNLILTTIYDLYKSGKKIKDILSAVLILI